MGEDGSIVNLKSDLQFGTLFHPKRHAVWRFLSKTESNINLFRLHGMKHRFLSSRMFTIRPFVVKAGRTRVATSQTAYTRLLQARRYGNGGRFAYLQTRFDA